MTKVKKKLRWLMPLLLALAGFFLPLVLSACTSNQVNVSINVINGLDSDGALVLYLGQEGVSSEGRLTVELRGLPSDSSNLIQAKSDSSILTPLRYETFSGSNRVDILFRANQGGNTQLTIQTLEYGGIRIIPVRIVEYPKAITQKANTLFYEKDSGRRYFRAEGIVSFTPASATERKITFYQDAGLTKELPSDSFGQYIDGNLVKETTTFWASSPYLKGIGSSYASFPFTVTFNDSLAWAGYRMGNYQLNNYIGNPVESLVFDKTNSVEVYIPANGENPSPNPSNEKNYIHEGSLTTDGKVISMVPEGVTTLSADIFLNQGYDKNSEISINYASRVIELVLSIDETITIKPIHSSDIIVSQISVESGLPGGIPSKSVIFRFLVQSAIVVGAEGKTVPLFFEIQAGEFTYAQRFSFAINLQNSPKDLLLNGTPFRAGENKSYYLFDKYENADGLRLSFAPETAGKVPYKVIFRMLAADAKRIEFVLPAGNWWKKQFLINNEWVDAGAGNAELATQVQYVFNGNSTGVNPIYLKAVTEGGALVSKTDIIANILFSYKIPDQEGTEYETLRTIRFTPALSSGSIQFGLSDSEIIFSEDDLTLFRDSDYLNLNLNGQAIKYLSFWENLGNTQLVGGMEIRSMPAGLVEITLVNNYTYKIKAVAVGEGFFELVAADGTLKRINIRVFSSIQADKVETYIGSPNQVAGLVDYKPYQSVSDLPDEWKNDSWVDKLSQGAKTFYAVAYKGSRIPFGVSYPSSATDVRIQYGYWLNGNFTTQNSINPDFRIEEGFLYINAETYGFTFMVKVTGYILNGNVREEYEIFLPIPVMSYIKMSELALSVNGSRKNSVELSDLNTVGYQALSLYSATVATVFMPNELNNSYNKNKIVWSTSVSLQQASYTASGWEELETDFFSFFPENGRLMAQVLKGREMPSKITLTANFSYPLDSNGNTTKYSVTYARSLEIRIQRAVTVEEIILDRYQVNMNFRTGETAPSAVLRPLVSPVNADNQELEYLFSPDAGVNRFLNVIPGVGSVTIQVIPSELGNSGKVPNKGWLHIIAKDSMETALTYSTFIKVRVEVRDGLSLSSPFEISSASEYLSVRNDPTKHYEINGAIDLSGYSFEQFYIPLFTGSLSGVNNAAITGIRLQTNTIARHDMDGVDGYKYGLFGVVRPSNAVNAAPIRYNHNETDQFGVLTSGTGIIRNISFSGSINVNITISVSGNPPPHTVGLVAAVNKGTFSNVAVMLQQSNVTAVSRSGSMYHYELYVGGVIGQNSGLIENYLAQGQETNLFVNTANEPFTIQDNRGTSYVPIPASALNGDTLYFGGVTGNNTGTIVRYVSLVENKEENGSITLKPYGTVSTLGNTAIAHLSVKYTGTMFASGDAYNYENDSIAVGGVVGKTERLLEEGTYIGGLFGISASGSIYAPVLNNVGGIAGLSVNSVISGQSTYLDNSTTDLSGNKNYVFESTTNNELDFDYITFSSSSVAVWGNRAVGGAVGQMYEGGKLSHTRVEAFEDATFATLILGRKFVGGLVGYVSGSASGLTPPNIPPQSEITYSSFISYIGNKIIEKLNVAEITEAQRKTYYYGDIVAFGFNDNGADNSVHTNQIVGGYGYIDDGCFKLSFVLAEAVLQVAAGQPAIANALMSSNRKLDPDSVFYVGSPRLRSAFAVNNVISGTIQFGGIDFDDSEIAGYYLNKLAYSYDGVGTSGSSYFSSMGVEVVLSKTRIALEPEFSFIRFAPTNIFIKLNNTYKDFYLGLERNGLIANAPSNMSAIYMIYYEAQDSSQQNKIDFLNRLPVFDFSDLANYGLMMKSSNESIITIDFLSGAIFVKGTGNVVLSFSSRYSPSLVYYVAVVVIPYAGNLSALTDGRVIDARVVVFNQNEAKSIQMQPSFSIAGVQIKSSDFAWQWQPIQFFKEDGTVISGYTGTASPPANSFGANGSFYINTSSFNYWEKVSGIWQPRNKILGMVTYALDGTPVKFSYHTSEERRIDSATNRYFLGPDNSLANATIVFPEGSFLFGRTTEIVNGVEYIFNGSVVSYIKTVSVKKIGDNYFPFEKTEILRRNIAEDIYFLGPDNNISNATLKFPANSFVGRTIEQVSGKAYIYDSASGYVFYSSLELYDKFAAAGILKTSLTGYAGGVNGATVFLNPEAETEQSGLYALSSFFSQSLSSFSYIHPLFDGLTVYKNMSESNTVIENLNFTNRNNFLNLPDYGAGESIPDNVRTYFLRTGSGDHATYTFVNTIQRGISFNYKIVPPTYSISTETARISIMPSDKAELKIEIHTMKKPEQFELELAIDSSRPASLSQTSWDAIRNELLDGMNVLRGEEISRSELISVTPFTSLPNNRYSALLTISMGSAVKNLMLTQPFSFDIILRTKPIDSDVADAVTRVTITINPQEITIISSIVKNLKVDSRDSIITGDEPFSEFESGSLVAGQVSKIESLVFPQVTDYAYVEIANAVVNGIPNPHRILFAVDSVLNAEKEEVWLSYTPVDGGIRFSKSELAKTDGHFYLRAFISLLVAEDIPLNYVIRVVGRSGQVIASEVFTVRTVQIPGVYIGIKNQYNVNLETGVPDELSERAIPVARGLRYPIDLRLNGYTRDQVEFTTENSDLASIELVGSTFFLVVTKNPINYAASLETEGFKIWISAKGKKFENDKWVESDTATLNLSIREYILNLQYDTVIVDGVTNFKDDNGILGLLRGFVGSSVPLKVKLTNNLVEYDTTNAEISAKVQKLANEFSINGKWEVRHINTGIQVPLQTTRAFPDEIYELFQNYFHVEEMGNKLLYLSFNRIISPEHALFEFIFSSGYQENRGEVLLNNPNESSNLNSVRNRFVIDAFSRSDTRNPFPIRTYEEFIDMRAGAHYILLDDIKLPKDFVPIDIAIGSLDGNNKSIIMPSITFSRGNINFKFGVFGTVSASTLLLNIRVKIVGNIQIDLVGNNNVVAGVLAGENLGIISNCSIVGDDYPTFTLLLSETITGGESSHTVGGLVGMNSGTISNSRVEVNIRTSGNLGGFVGTNEGAIVASYVSGVSIINDSVASGVKTGGFVADNIGSGKIQTSYVSGAYKIPQFSNQSYGSFADNMNVSVYSGAAIGGFVHTNNALIRDCYSNIPITGVGVGNAGFVCRNNSRGNITNTYSTSLMVALGLSQMANAPFVSIIGTTVYNSGVISNSFAVYNSVDLRYDSNNQPYLLSDKNVRQDIYFQSYTKSNGEQVKIFPTSTLNRIFNNVANTSVPGLTIITDTVTSNISTTFGSVTGVFEGDFAFQKMRNSVTFSNPILDSDIGTQVSEKIDASFTFSTTGKKTDGVWFFANEQGADSEFLRSGVPIQFKPGRPELVAANFIAVRERELDSLNPSTIDEETGSVKYHYIESVHYALGSSNNPILIASPYDLEIVAEDGLINNKHYRLISDINYEDAQELSVSKLFQTRFIGSFDGNNFNVSSFTINTNEDLPVAGFFGSIGTQNNQEGVIKNLTLIPRYINTPNVSAVGVLAGELVGGTVVNVHINGRGQASSSAGGIELLGKHAVGGLIGHVSSSFNISHVSCNVSVNAGYLASNLGRYIEIYNGKNLDRISYAGGIIGILDGSGTLTHAVVRNAYTLIGEVAGGFVGYLGAQATLENMTRVDYYGASIRPSVYGGLIAGHNLGTIQKINIQGATGDFNTEGLTTVAVGGVAGLMDGNSFSRISKVNFTSVVIISSTASIIGGMVGEMRGGHINDSSITQPNLKGNLIVGGMIGLAGNSVLLQNGKIHYIRLFLNDIYLENNNIIGGNLQTTGRSADLYLGLLVGRVATFDPNIDDRESSYYANKRGANLHIDSVNQKLVDAYANEQLRLKPDKYFNVADSAGELQRMFLLQEFMPQTNMSITSEHNNKNEEINLYFGVFGSRVLRYNVDDRWQNNIYLSKDEGRTTISSAEDALYYYRDYFNIISTVNWVHSEKMAIYFENIMIYCFRPSPSSDTTIPNLDVFNVGATRKSQVFNIKDPKQETYGNLLTGAEAIGSYAKALLSVLSRPEIVGQF